MAGTVPNMDRTSQAGRSQPEAGDKLSTGGSESGGSAALERPAKSVFPVTVDGPDDVERALAMLQPGESVRFGPAGAGGERAGLGCNVSDFGDWWPEFPQTDGACSSCTDGGPTVVYEVELGNPVAPARAPDTGSPEGRKFWQWLRRHFTGRGMGCAAAAALLDEDADALLAMYVSLRFPPLAVRRRWARALGWADTYGFEAEWRRTDVRLHPAVRDAAGARKVAVINKAPAGAPFDYGELGHDSGTGIDYVDAPPHLVAEVDRGLFAFVVYGDSMTPAYRHGDLVFALPVDASLPDPGDPAADLDARQALPAGAAVFVRFGAAEPTLACRCTFKAYHPLRRREEMRLTPLNRRGRHRAFTVLREHVARLAAAVHVEPSWWDVGRHERGVRLELDGDPPPAAGAAARPVG